ncbi:hypothetical protein [Nocardia aurea]|uniref:hypothetical protein n=1 Tax=Nocardia aurea TaxID=2144174 RepID=UPI0033AF3EC6
MPTLIVLIVAIVAAFLLLNGLDRENAAACTGFHCMIPSDLDAAHEAWQDHAECDINNCSAKSHAYWMLADAGMLQPTAQMARKRVTS